MEPGSDLDDVQVAAHSEVSASPHPIEEKVPPSDDDVVAALSRELEEILSVNRLRCHAHEGCVAEEKTITAADPAAPTSVLAAMDDSLTVPMSYLMGIASVQNIVPRGLDNKSIAELFASATHMSQKIVLRRKLEEFRFGPFPQAFVRSRCTLTIRGVNATVTVEDVQKVIPQHTIFHFYRLSPELINVTFEDARSAKESFVLLQGKSIGGCVSVEVKLRMGTNKQTTHIPRQTSRSWTNVGEGDTPAVSPVAPLDAYLPSTTMKIPTFACQAWTEASNSDRMFQHMSLMQQQQQQQQYADGLPQGGRRRLYRTDMRNTMLSNYTPPIMGCFPMLRCTWKNKVAPGDVAAAAATVATNKCEGQWNENERTLGCNTLLTPISNNETSVNVPVLSAPLPLGDDGCQYVEGNPRMPLPCGAYLDTDMLRYNAHYRDGATMRPAAFGEGSLVRPPDETKQSAGNEPTRQTRSRRLQRDPYKGGILVDSPEVSREASRAFPPPTSTINYRPRCMDNKILSPRMLRHVFSLESNERLKVVSSMVDDESSPQLTPDETSSQAQSDADTSGAGRAPSTADLKRASDVVIPFDQ